MIEQHSSVSTIPPSLMGSSGQEIREATQDIALACIAAFVEANRHKGGGLMGFKKPREMVEYLGIARWPFVIVRRSGTPEYAVFDALGVLSNTVKYERLPDTADLVSSLESERRMLETTADAVGTYASYKDILGTIKDRMKHFGGSEDIIVRGAIDCKEYAGDLADGMSVDACGDGSDAISRRLSSDAIRQGLSLLDELEKAGARDTASLESFQTTSVSVEKAWMQRLFAQRAETAERYAELHARVSEEVEDQLQALRAECDRQLYRVQARLEERKSHLRRDAEREEQLAAGARGGRSERAEERYDRHMAQAACAHEQMTELDEEARRESNRIKDHYGDLTRKELDRLKAVEKDRDSELNDLEKKRENVERLGKEIGNNISKLIDAKRMTLQTLRTTYIQPHPSLSENADVIVMVPLYVGMLVEDGSHKKRYLIHPPFTVKANKNTGDRLKQLVHMTVQPMDARTKAFAATADRFASNLENDQELQRELDTILMRQTRAGNASTVSAIQLGLGKLRTMNLISEKEEQNLSKACRDFFTIPV